MPHPSPRQALARRASVAASTLRSPARSLWILMELCEGGSVADLIHISQAPLSEAQIRYITRESFTGISYLHSLGRLHRDLKCGNILLTSDGEVKLADFGVATQMSGTFGGQQTFIGTPHWMAPEIIKHNR